MEDFDFEPSKSWPFKKMDVGDVVVVEVRAQTYVHVYGRQSGKKFATRTNKQTGMLHVKRIA